jgi:hypothetical protein
MNGAGKPRYTLVEDWDIVPSLYLGCIKSNSTWIEDVTIRPDTLKLLKESNSIYKHSHGLFE